MARGGLNKSALTQEKRALSSYRAFLPALELKRRTLLYARSREVLELAVHQEAGSRLLAEAADKLPMMAQDGLNLDDLLVVKAIERSEESIVGVRLPVLLRIEFHQPVLNGFLWPHWIEPAVQLAQDRVTAAIAEAISRKRLRLLDVAIAKTTQRVNLLEKRLIPQAAGRLRAIELRLAELERAGVVIAKIAKARMAGGKAL